jgi:hypothetical protein
MGLNREQRSWSASKRDVAVRTSSLDAHVGSLDEGLESKGAVGLRLHPELLPGADGGTVPVADRAVAAAVLGNEEEAVVNELPRSKLRGINPPLARGDGPPVWRGHTGPACPA